ncbi:MAG: GNAT family N-acetyltransferase [Gemmatimonadetes bacterium]|nr:GNAT family N-acetyltransferase [Gemmatimonadota bacterium]
MTDAEAMLIRDAREDERRAIRAITFASYVEYASSMEPGAWAALEQALVGALAAEGPAQRIVAERGGKLIGSVMLYPRAADAYVGAVAEAHWPELRILAVAPEARGHGVGEALVKECVRRAREAGASDLGLHTSQTMKAAVRMYERLGFVRVPDHDFQPEGGELVTAYRLQLRDPQLLPQP